MTLSSFFQALERTCYNVIADAVLCKKSDHDFAQGIVAPIRECAVSRLSDFGEGNEEVVFRDLIGRQAVCRVERCRGG
jgi:hypothetical protein